MTAGVPTWGTEVGGMAQLITDPLTTPGGRTFGPAGVLLTPILALHFGIPIRQAIGTSLVAVITTSAASSSVHLQRHTTDIRLGMTLELATALGAAVMAYLVGYFNRNALEGLFAGFLLYSAITILRQGPKGETVGEESTHAANEISIPPYEPKRYPLGLAASLVAGALSGLLGIGGGPIKVPVMYIFMKVPLMVATATSNFMIGVTAAASDLWGVLPRDRAPGCAGRHDRAGRAKS